ncbi:hypothetical protein MMC14_009085 [Varicellaria rhodocarpa]|nr:hypothetical protein [Varicellaria rhodocarpa]
MAHVISTNKDAPIMENGTSPLLESVPNAYFQLTTAQMLVFGAITILTAQFLRGFFGGVKAPFVGYRSKWEPGLLVRLRFLTSGRSMIMDGYNRFKDSVFKVSRLDGDILILSNKYVDELRSVPEENISAIKAHQHALLGNYSTTWIMAESDLHTRVLQTKLTPSLALLVAPVKEELDFALDKEMPNCNDEWVEVALGQIILRLVARVSARVFLGPKVCRDEKWLQTSIHYTEDVFMVILTLRFFPPYLRPFVAAVLPATWKVRAHLRTAKKIIVPIINAGRKAEKEDPRYEKPSTLLQWMMDAANEDEGKPHKLAHRQLLLSLAAIHTTTMAASHAIYDLCSMPELFEPLREEIVEVLEHDRAWLKQGLNKMRKMDSFLRESQRFSPSSWRTSHIPSSSLPSNPQPPPHTHFPKTKIHPTHHLPSPSLVTFNRIVQTPTTLSDGLHLPAGTHFCIASGAIARDPNIVPSPERFDAFRWSTKRAAEPEDSHRHQHAVTDKYTMHFGHGRYACPGRFFASNEIKMIVAHLIMRYEWRFREGEGRPVNLSLDENLFPDPEARVLVRRRGRGGVDRI